MLSYSENKVIKYFFKKKPRPSARTEQYVNTVFFVRGQDSRTKEGMLNSAEVGTRMTILVYTF